MKTIGRILALSLFLVGSAKADVPPPETEPCRSAAVGTACTYLGTAGTCTNSTCSRLDYANWNRDASASPPSTTYACVVCKASTDARTTTDTAATDTAATDTATTDTATTDTTDTPTDTATADTAKADTAKATTTDAPTDTATTTMTTSTTGSAMDSGTAPPEKKEGSGCQMGDVSMKRVAPWMLAGSFSLLFLFARRRRTH